MKKFIQFLVLGGCLVVPPLRAEAAKAVTWTTPDGVRIQGLYQPPQRPEGRVWVLLHGLGSNKQEWLAFVSQLMKQGGGFLIYDARGHGDSVTKTDGTTLGYKEFQTAGSGSQWDHMTDDLGDAVKLLVKTYALKPSQIAVGGASLGANVALVYASEHPEVPAVILLSPGLSYAGVESGPAFARYTPRPVFMAASPDDRYAFDSVRQLTASRSDAACRVASGIGSAHGVNMLNAEMTRKLLDWIKNVETK